MSEKIIEKTEYTCDVCMTKIQDFSSYLELKFKTRFEEEQKLHFCTDCYDQLEKIMKERLQEQT